MPAFRGHGRVVNACPFGLLLAPVYTRLGRDDPGNVIEGAVPVFGFDGRAEGGTGLL